MAKKKKKKVSPRTEQKNNNIRSFINDSPWSQVSEEIRQGWELRKDIIGKIEQRLRGKIIVYFTSFYDEDAMISDMDAEMIEGMLATEYIGGKIILILNSAGGSGLAAERIVSANLSPSNIQEGVRHHISIHSSAVLSATVRINSTKISEVSGQGKHPSSSTTLFHSDAIFSASVIGFLQELIHKTAYLFKGSGMYLD